LNNLPGFSLIPLICLGVFLVSGIVILFSLRRGTRSIQDYLEKQETTPHQTENHDTRWAKAELKSSAEPSSPSVIPAKCPACGGENPADEKTCQFCGGDL